MWIDAHVSASRHMWIDAHVSASRHMWIDVHIPASRHMWIDAHVPASRHMWSISIIEKNYFSDMIYFLYVFFSNKTTFHSLLNACYSLICSIEVSKQSLYHGKSGCLNKIYSKVVYSSAPPFLFKGGRIQSD